MSSIFVKLVSEFPSKILVGSSLLLSGCLSMQNQSSLEALGEQLSKIPVVEGFIEFPGPAEKWSGPSSFVLHLVAKDSGLARASVMPALFDKKDLARGKGISGDLARTHLGELAKSLQGAEETFRGCMYPVRVRLIRANGTLIEKQGCRGQSPWTRNATELVNTVVSLSLGIKSDKVAQLSPQ